MLKFSQIIGDFSYTPEFAYVYKLHTEELLEKFETSNSSRIKLVAPFDQNPNARKLEIIRSLESAVRIGQFAESQKLRSDWNYTYTNVAANFRKSVDFIKDARIRLSRDFFRREEPDKSEFVRIFRRVALSLNGSSNNEANTAYAEKRAEELWQAISQLDALVRDFEKFAENDRSEIKNPGQPGKIAFVLRLSETWERLTGSKPPVEAKEQSPFLKFVEVCWIDVGGNSDVDFLHSARVAGKRYRIAPKRYY